MSPPLATAITQHGQTLAFRKVTLPDLQAHQVYVKVEIAAFNPTDRLAFDLNAFGNGAVLGCDFVGTVIEAHPSVTKLAVGDRVAALVWGGEVQGLGAYASCCIADERISFKIPDCVVPPASAVAVPLAANTAYLALFSSTSLGLPKTAAPGQSLLVWGGSSVVGYLAIQFAKLHGYTVATTCSPRNFDVVRRAGALHVFDYADPEVVSKIRTEVPNLGSVFDTIGNASSSATAAAALKDGTGALCTVRPGKANTQDVPSTVRISDVFVFTAFPTPHSYRGAAHWPVIMENHQISAELYDRLPGLLKDKLIVPPPVKNVGRLEPETLQTAMALNRDGNVSFEKLYFEVNLDA